MTEAHARPGGGVAEDVRARAADLRSRRVPFVSATVVRAERPTSAKAGDAAVVLSDGTIVGFVGGECAETSVRAQAISALRTGEPVLLRITPEGPGEAEEDPGALEVHNPCLSGGTLEIFLDPELPPPVMVVHGEGPIARALGAVAEQVGYEICAPGPVPAVVPEDASAVVVAAHGRGEAEVLLAAVRAGVPYIGLVASRRRGSLVLDALGLPAEQRERIRTPAGLDINARTPGEVAVSILAEIVSLKPHRPSAEASAGSSRPASAAGADAEGIAGGRPVAGLAVDPVCGMTVPAADGTLSAVQEGQLTYFCGSGCRDAFLADPAAFGAPR